MQREVIADGVHVGHGGDPDGPPVVFVHGALDRGAAFLRSTRLLGDVSWWVYDRRGYGRSLTDEPLSLDGHVSDLVALLEVVRARSGRSAVVVGHSLGGTIALGAAHRRPELVAAVVAYESPLLWLDWWPRRGPGGGRALEDDEPEIAVERFMRRVAGDDVWEALPAPTRDRRLAEGHALVAELATARAAAPFDPAAIPVPVTIAHGAHADDHRRRAATELHEQIPGARLVVLPDAHHGAHVSRADDFAALVRGALVGIEPSRLASAPVSDSRPVSLNPSGPPETILPEAPAASRHRLEQALARPEGERRAAVAEVVAAEPRWSAAWAALGDCGRDDIEAYAAYRVGYHRGLDSLRANGWRGSGYVRWQHPSNQGFLRALSGLARQAARIGEDDEAERCELFLRQCDPSWPPADLSTPQEA